MTDNEELIQYEKIITFNEMPFVEANFRKGFEDQSKFTRCHINSLMECFKMLHKENDDKDA